MSLWRRALDRWTELSKSSSGLNQEGGATQGSPRLQKGPACWELQQRSSVLQCRPTHLFSQAAPPFPPLRSSPSTSPSLAVPSSLRHLLAGVDSSPRPRMTDTWPLACMNKSRHSGHLPKAMPGQLITVNHTPATYEHTSTQESSGLGKQGSRPTEGKKERK